MTNLNKAVTKKHFQKNTSGTFVENAAYLRARFFLTGTSTKETVERYGCKDDARNEARTATARIIRHTRRNNCGVAGYITEVLKLYSNGHKGKARTICEKTPPEAFKVVIKSLCDYEKRTGNPIGRILSIRPVIERDKMGYFIKRVTLVDNPKKITRIDKGNDYNDAF